MYAYTYVNCKTLSKNKKNYYKVVKGKTVCIWQLFVKSFKIQIMNLQMYLPLLRFFLLLFLRYEMGFLPIFLIVDVLEYKSKLVFLWIFNENFWTFFKNVWANEWDSEREYTNDIHTHTYTWAFFFFFWVWWSNITESAKVMATNDCINI